jgi:hypothetical protein
MTYYNSDSVITSKQKNRFTCVHPRFDDWYGEFFVKGYSYFTTSDIVCIHTKNSYAFGVVLDIPYLISVGPMKENILEVHELLNRYHIELFHPCIYHSYFVSRGFYNCVVSDYLADCSVYEKIMYKYSLKYTLKKSYLFLRYLIDRYIDIDEKLATNYKWNSVRFSQNNMYEFLKTSGLACQIKIEGGGNGSHTTTNRQ